MPTAVAGIALTNAPMVVSALVVPAPRTVTSPRTVMVVVAGRGGGDPSHQQPTCRQNGKQQDSSHWFGLGIANATRLRIGPSRVELRAARRGAVGAPRIPSGPGSYALNWPRPSPARGRMPAVEARPQPVPENLCP